ncbi:MAG: phytoene desaturase family protein [Chloroflexota bacterium]
MSAKNPSILIIGGGIAGLSAGCYAQMNGFQSQVFEMHHLPGGLCTAWERKDYVFDGCIHYLFGSGEGQPFNRMWQELGAVQGRQFIDHDEFMRVRGPAGQELIVYTDPDRLEAHLLALSPADAAHIHAFCRGIRAFERFDMSVLNEKPRPLMNALDWRAFGQKMTPFLLPLAQWGMLPADRFAQRFKDPFLRQAIPQMFAWSSIPMMVGMSLLAAMHNRNAGFPVGASLEFARAIERRYTALGGQVHYSAQVERVLVENDRAVGVRLYNNEEYYADAIIAACDGHNLIFDMLGGRYADRALRRQYDGHLPVHSQLQVSLGVNRDFSAEPHWTTYLLDQPVEIAGQPRSEIGVKHYCFDPSLAPQGKSVVEIMLTTPYEYWQRIYGRRIYNEEQLQESGVLVDWLETVYPGLKGCIEVNDVATPLSYERYTGNWLGSSCGWLLTRETMFSMINGMRKTLPGLDGLYLAGQWVEPGGSVPLAAASGRNAVQFICNAAGRPFESSLP